jgi:hypothetical protein
MKTCPSCGYKNNPDPNTICLKCHKRFTENSSENDLNEKPTQEVSNTIPKEPVDFSKYVDPKNTLWLDIVRWTNVVINILAIISLIYLFLDGFLEFHILLLGFISVFVLHLFQMLSLNALYNIQQIRINSDRQIELLENMQNKQE